MVSRVASVRVRVMGKVNVVSLFGGMECGRIALDMAGIEVGSYFSSEILEPAIKVSSFNYPDIIHLGDITKWREWDIDWASIGLIIGGSPCQGVSGIGTQLGLEDDRSSLFFVYMDIVNHCIELNNDVKFMLENTTMKLETLQVINEYMGITPTMINSNLVSAQNRKRMYWASWLPEGIPQPKDKGVLLNEILDPNIHTRHDAPLKLKSKCLRRGGKGSPLGGKHEWDSPFKVTSREVAKNLPVYFHKRRFSIPEKERLQGVPVGYTMNAGVTENQASDMIGNGWEVRTIAHIFNYLKEL